MKQVQTLKFTPFPLQNITPKGWLNRQLEIQASGLSGHLDEFWPDIKDSAWFGGDAEGWERGPYWLDGIMPLAYLLKSEVLCEKVRKYMGYIIENQHEDGWLGPKESNVSNPEAKEGYDIWAQFLALKMLVQYHQITADPRAVIAVKKGLRKIDESINWVPLFDWGQARWFEALIPIFWLYEKQPESWLLDLATKLEAQGFGWDKFFKSWPMTKATKKNGWNFMSHVVNNAMAVKAYALTSRNSSQSSNQETVDHMISLLDKYHGTAVGTFSGDECLAGKEPTRGTELCAIVEYMYSLEHLVQVYGDVKYSDRLEKIAFNALPAAFTRDMWAHQYDQQVNQVACKVDESMPWCTNDPDANIYGLEPHFGCCTSNYHQGWPKFAANLWMATEDGGLAAVAFAPSALSSEVGGVHTSVELITDYPFKHDLHFKISSEKPNQFPFYLRIPEWVQEAAVTINGEPAENIVVGEYFKIEQEWHLECVVAVKFTSKVNVKDRLNGAVSFEHGPLVYALPIKEKREQINQDKPYREFPHCDYEITALSPWNYAISTQSIFDTTEKMIDQNTPFSSLHPPVILKVKGKIVPQWQMQGAAAAPVPHNPETEENEQNLKLVPFGCTHLRIGEFPSY
ncbi:beta-L-arabinofuranosidase domain-containing protein [Psychromonas ossibalaenae]|uniref:beta-L-arabinofuranosidase domain-containing protein n=1 Tax=Psychromonas ossibalaenae TaxID=444922 RepID=UPI0003749008|nr:beta-L-arabinofuranosidase domain-containing protein [Psychromonas ossibalaenae]